MTRVAGELLGDHIMIESFPIITVPFRVVNPREKNRNLFLGPLTRARTGVFESGALY